MAENRSSEEAFMSNQYRLVGRHAYESIRLTSEIDPPRKNVKIFNRNVDVIKNAPLVGFIYNRRADIDKEMIDPETKKPYDYSVMEQQMYYAHKELMFNFRIIMLLDKDYEPDGEKRVDKGMKHFAEDKADQERFEQYLRGGIDVLYEKLIKENNPRTPEEYLSNVFEFVSDFHDSFYATIDKEDLLERLRK